LRELGLLARFNQTSLNSVSLIPLPTSKPSEESLTIDTFIEQFVHNVCFEILTGGYEEFYLLGYNAVYTVEYQPTFRKNMSPPSSGSKNRPRTCFHAGFLLSLFFDPRDGGEMFLRNVGSLSTD
jgi:hypothetical protein